MTWVMNESSSSSSNDSSRGGGGGGAGAGGSKWNESGGGTNHLLLFAWDQASEILGWNHPTRLLVKSAIHLTTLGTVGVSPNFDPHKDIVIPPYANYSQVVLELYPGVDEVSRGVGGGGGGGLGSSAKWKDYRSENVSPTTLFPSWVHGRSDNFNSFDSDSLQSQQKKDEGFEVQEMTGSGNPYSHFSSINNRSMFAYFRGTFISNHNYSHGVRQFLQELGKTHADRYHIKEWHSSKYWEEMGDAVFSLCPSGWSPWSPRLL